MKFPLKHRLFLLVATAFSLFAAFWGWLNTLNGNASGYSPAFWWLGIFTWDDAAILGTFLLIASIILIQRNSSTVTGMFFSIYGAVRAGIEALYNLNAQFSSITRPWEIALPTVAATLHLKLVELFVVAQVCYTALCVTFIMIFLSCLKRYLRS